MKKKFSFKLRRKALPYIQYIVFCFVLYLFLLGYDNNIPVAVFILILQLFIWYEGFPDLAPPDAKDFDPNNMSRGPRLSDTEEFRQLDPSLMQQKLAFEMQSWMISDRVYEDWKFRYRLIALALFLIILGTAVLFWLEEYVIIWRAKLIFNLCVAGLLTLLVLSFIHSFRKKS